MGVITVGIDDEIIGCSGYDALFGIDLVEKLSPF
jgi:hypothetical protein